MRTVTCLYVDDDPGIRDLVSLNLRAEGVRVVLAESAVDAETLVEEIRPDVILLDVMMPQRDGYDLLRSLKADDAHRHIPVVLLTARASDAEIWEGWQAGADYYLTKPFNVFELVEYLRVVLRERTPA